MDFDASFKLNMPWFSLNRGPQSVAGIKGPLVPLEFYNIKLSQTMPLIGEDWGDQGIVSQYSTPDFYFQNYFGYQSCQDETYGPEILLAVLGQTAATDVILMGYYGYSVPLAYRLLSDENVELVTLSTGVDQELDTDAEQQILQPLWNFDLIEERNESPIIPINVWDSIEQENQKQQDPYQLDEEIIDNTTELIIPINVWDMNTEHQLLQLLWYIDLFDERPEQFYIPTMELDHDGDNQKLQDTYFTDRDTADAGVELVQYSPGIIRGWDTDSDSQFLQPGWYNDEDISDVQVELITIYDYTWDIDENKFPQQFQFNTDDESDWTSNITHILFSDVILMGYYGYSVLPGSRYDIQDWTQYIIIISAITDYTWDTDDNQISQASWNLDIIEEQAQFILLEVLDEPGINPINTGYTFDGEVDGGVVYSALTIHQLQFWDTDADVQFQQAAWQQDGDVDTELTRIVIPTVAEDTDADNQLQQAAWSLDLIEEYAKLPFLPVIELDVEQQLQQAGWYQDVVDERNELPIIPVMELDTDSFQQLQQSSYQLDTDLSDTVVERIQLTDNTWDVDDSRQWIDYQLDRDIDTSVEIVLVSVQDEAHQQPWTFQSIDQIEERNLYPIIPVMEIDLDTEYQFQQPDWVKDVLADETVEKITLNPFVNVLTAYDTDAENQLAWPLNFGTDTLSDEALELITVNVGVDRELDDLQDKVWAGYNLDQVEDWTQYPIVPEVLDNVAEQQYSTQVIALDTIDEGVERLPVVLTVTEPWDNDVENQIQWAVNTSDSIEDQTQFQLITIQDELPQQPWIEQVKDQVDDQPSLILYLALDFDDQFTQIQWKQDQIDDRPQLLIIPAAYDTDADTQKLQESYTTDRDLLDTGVELLTIPPTVFQLYAWDSDSEQQLPTPSYMLDMDSADTGVEHIIIPEAYDSDSVQQFPQPAWYLDYEEEREGVPYIIVKPGIIRDWDADVSNMIPQPGWVNYYEDGDLYQYIPPVVILVPILYKLSTTPSIHLEFITTPETVLYEFTAQNSIKINQYTSVLSMSLYKLTVQNSMTMQSFTIHGAS